MSTPDWEAAFRSENARLLAFVKVLAAEQELNAALRKEIAELNSALINEIDARRKKPSCETLTGKTRCRIDNFGLFRKRHVLILQVRETWPDGPSDSRIAPSFLSGSGWRDATVEDLTTLNGGRL